MELIVKLNGNREKAKVSFAQASDFGFAEKWRNTLGTDQNPFRVDAVEFAELAIKRYEASSGSGIYATSLADFSDHITHNPLAEVGCFIVLKCGWFPDADVIGFCHFRRSWKNKIILDYLAAHPFIVRPADNPSHLVTGAGVALLYFISQIVKTHRCEAMWGEATHTSAPYYKNMFKLESVDDLIVAPNENLLKFAESREKEWAAKGDSVALMDKKLDEVYALEVENPPFVGSKTAMFSPTKRLGTRFMRLSHQKQLKIAKQLVLIENGESEQPSDELYERIFTRAREMKKLAALWSAVESESGGGLSEENPFNVEQSQRT